ncbi:MAG TPA: hypothetical protein PK700_05560 [Bacillota bacterium]|nr:hypothetical protein [Bacillota bacterium]
MPLNNLCGRATGIGSTPHPNPAAALDLIFTYFKEIPHWPQLPRRGAAEGLARQYLGPLLKHGLISPRPNGTPYFCLDDPGWEKRCLDYYELLLAGENALQSSEFAFMEESAAGFYAFLERCARQPSPEALCLKGQVAGPITVGFRVTDPAGKPSFYDPSLREIIVKTLAAAACWQARQLQAFGSPALIFVDEPALYHYGTSTAVGLGRPEIEASLEEIFTAVRSTGGLTGLHSCAGNDWSLVTGLSLDIINFDAYDYFSSLLVYSDLLNPFFTRGGALAWGIVPSSEKAQSEELSSLQRLFESQVEALVKQGVDENYLRSRYLITPSCGAGTLSPDLTERVYYLTASLAERIS